MTDNLLRRITIDPPVTVMETGIMCAMNYFLDNNFLVSINNQFPAGQQPAIPPLPANWRNNIVTMPQGDSFARFFIRRKNQTFRLSFTHDSDAQVVFASPRVSSWKWINSSTKVNISYYVYFQHTVVNHKDLTVVFKEDQLGALLNDPAHRDRLCLHFVKICSDEWHKT